jgi:hypothetical protein
MLKTNTLIHLSLTGLIALTLVSGLTACRAEVQVEDPKTGVDSEDATADDVESIEPDSESRKRDSSGSTEPRKSSGPLSALTWHTTPAGTDRLTNYVGVRHFRGFQKDGASAGKSAAEKIMDLPKSRRGLFLNSVGFHLLQDPWKTENVNDRTIATAITEQISGAKRNKISVEPLPYDLEDGHELTIQTGDPNDIPLTRDDVTFAYVDGGASKGDTLLKISDKEGNPVKLTASQGDRVLSEYQSPWLIHATAEVKNAMKAFMRGFVSEGGHIDNIVLDVEAHIGASKGIKHDPRWDDPEFGINGQSLKEILAPHTIDQVMDNDNDAKLKWGAEISKRMLARKLNESIFRIIQQDFPEVTGSNYENTGITKEEAKWAPQTDGQRQYRPYIFGTHGSKPLYASIRNLTKVSKGMLNLPYSYGDSPFATVRWQVQYARAMYRSTQGQIQPWITYEGLADSFFSVDVRGTPYYEEYVRHVALHVDSGVPLLYFNPHPPNGEPETTDGSAATIQNDKDVNRVLEDVNDALSHREFKTVTTEPVEWLSAPLVTGVKTGDQIIWRVTIKRVDPHDERPVKINVSNGDKLTVPGGQVGIWYETSTGVRPDFNYKHPPVENLYENHTWQGLGNGKWKGKNSATSIIRNEEGPDGESTAIKIEQSCCDSKLGALSGPTFPVEKEKHYTFSFWTKRTGGNYSLRVKSPNLSNRVGAVWLTSSHTDRDWHRIRVPFFSGDYTKLRLQFRGQFPDFLLAKPMLNRHQNMGPYKAP